jgi:hypothetical protein
MRPGAGKSKGSAFERQVCTQLSLWVTHGARSDVFTRNVSSGGQFTVRKSKDDNEHGVAGDIMAHHPSAYDFLKKVMVECKHHKDLNLDTYLYDTRGSSTLAKIIAKCEKEAGQSTVFWLLIAKQNNRAPLIFMGNHAGETATASCYKGFNLLGHLLHRVVYVFEFERFKQGVDPEKFVEKLGNT